MKRVETDRTLLSSFIINLTEVVCSKYCILCHKTHLEKFKRSNIQSVLLDHNGIKQKSSKDNCKIPKYVH